MPVDVEILIAMAANLLSWFVSTFAPSFMSMLLPKIAEEATSDATSEGGDPTSKNNRQTKCIVIGRPGGSEQLRVIALMPGIVTCGYNLPRCSGPFTKISDDELPADCVLLQNEAFSVNYADCCIRWGLYESAKKFVGWPICPGFDVAGVVERVGTTVEHDLKVGDRVFGCSLFGAYSSRVLVPQGQLKRMPAGLSTQQAAALPAVSLTALYALYLAGHFGVNYALKNKAILIHSAAGGVGSMLVQMSKILGLSPIVGVVGRTSKVDAAKQLGCDVVIDKSREDLWERAKQSAPTGYASIMDANGVSTLQQSYDHLASAGRLIVYGFHSNLPLGRAMLSPMEWIGMAQKQAGMPKFDPMDLTVSSKSVLAFNLSFFADETELLSQFFDQICKWLEEGKLQCPRVVDLVMSQVVEGHELIQSGKSIGKIVLSVQT